MKENGNICSQYPDQDLNPITAKCEARVISTLLNPIEHSCTQNPFQES